LYDEVELPLINVLAEMELEGIRIDEKYFRKLSKQACEDLARLTAEVYEIAGEQFTINSPKQVSEILFSKFNLTPGKKGKSGVYSTDVTVLEALKDEHPLPAKLLEFRQVEKLKSTYIDPLPGMINPVTGRVHTSFNQTIAATGRLSSSNPNLQNIPVRTEAGRQIRRGFIARDAGWKLLAADYSQIELRILAHLSKDAELSEAFRTGADIHTQTASRVFGVAPGDVTSLMRSQAKAINFGIIYGMSDFRLARDLEISRDQARQFIDDYFRVHSGVQAYIEAMKETARRDGYVTTLLGRRRFIPDIRSRNFNQRSFAERIAVNTPIQGASADMIKMAMIRVSERLHREERRARMLLQVHDELILDVPEGEIDAIKTLVSEEMAGALILDVPIKVDMEVGDNWADI
jgi:DNA polymerase-1